MVRFTALFDTRPQLGPSYATYHGRVNFVILDNKAEDLILRRDESVAVTRKRDRETGQYQRVYTEEEITELLDGTRLSTAEVAEALGCHRTTAHERLTDLEEAGVVNSTRVGSAKVWERCDDS